MNKVMNYLDRFHLKNAGDQSLTQTSLQIFRQSIYKKWLPELRKSILEQIRKDRDSELVDNNLVRDSIQQFIFMGFDQKVVIKKFEGSNDLHWVGDKNLARYDDEFEKQFQQNSTEYFAQKAQTWFSSLVCFEYVEKINYHLQKEEANADYYLQEQTKPKIINIVLN